MLLEAYERTPNCGRSILNLGEHQLPNAKGGAVLLNILVFLNSNTCSAGTIHKKSSYLLRASQIPDLISL